MQQPVGAAVTKSIAIIDVGSSVVQQHLQDSELLKAGGDGPGQVMEGRLAAAAAPHTARSRCRMQQMSLPAEQSHDGYVKSLDNPQILYLCASQAIVI